MLTKDTKNTLENCFSLLYFIIHFAYLLAGTSLYAIDLHEAHLQTENIVTVTLSKSREHQEFIDFVSKLDYDPYSTKDSFTWGTVLPLHLRRLLPERLVETLHEAGITYEPSVIVIRGLPIDPEIPRFESHSLADRARRADAKPTKISESVIHALTGLMGYCIESVPTEHQGRNIHNIIPINGEEESVSSIGKVELDFHIDGFYASKAPEFVILLGLEPDFPGDTQAATSYLFIEPFLRDFDPAIIEEMKKPQFKYISSNCIIESAIEDCFPLIQHEGGRVRFRFFSYKNVIFGLNPTAERVLSYIKEKLSQQTIPGSVVLQPGDALIINNGWGLNKPGGVMHARQGYISNPCRWMQRGYMYRKIDEIDQDIIGSAGFSTIRHENIS